MLKKLLIAMLTCAITAITALIATFTSAVQAQDFYTKLESVDQLNGKVSSVYYVRPYAGYIEFHYVDEDPMNPIFFTIEEGSSLDKHTRACWKTMKCFIEAEFKDGEVVKIIKASPIKQ